ncbi:hypothetical protein T11_5280 [Trichinella zimbabwensis]|uniref:Uncharacterized protein n=1 Tax=Trichinella zimbabwensis TaxID=268475 RepID=A0A0V1H1M2_9BILA|nr:hypothetical protein T11_5280 [Trichinella zimbabwensis]
MKNDDSPAPDRNMTKTKIQSNQKPDCQEKNLASSHFLSHKTIQCTWYCISVELENCFTLL